MDRVQTGRGKAEMEVGTAKMRERGRREPIPFPVGEARETRSLSEWEKSVNQRNNAYASALAKAMDAGLNPDEARNVARQSFLKSFDERPETEFEVPLAGTEVAPMPRRGRRAA